MLNKVAIVGGGTMGNGIAQVFASAGSQVTLIDISEEVLSRAQATIGKNLARMVKKERITQEQAEESLARLSCTTTLDGASDADLVVEAVPEKFELKAKILGDLDKIIGPDCILASNTSSISITRLASTTGRADKVIGMHFMNPVPVMKLVEVIKGQDTSEATTTAVLEATKAVGKIAVPAEDYPGSSATGCSCP